MATETTSVLEVGDRLIQFGCARKTRVQRRVNFARPFSTPPRVVLTPFWEDAEREVGHAETIGRVTEDHFLLFSDNRASTYFVSWIAVGYASGGRDENVDYVQAGDLVLEFGRAPKTGVSLTVPLRFPFAHPPNIQVSPFWEGQRRGVGHAETLSRVDRRSFDVWSDNRAPDYFVSWLAAGTPRRDLPPREAEGLGRGWFVSEFRVGDMELRTQRGPLFRRGGAGFIGIGSPFAAPPTVVVTPLWEGQGRGVSHAETITVIEPHAVRLAASNAAPNYFVSMLAIGPRR
jgi:hypothetical protein